MNRGMMDRQMYAYGGQVRRMQAGGDPMMAPPAPGGAMPPPQPPVGLPGPQNVSMDQALTGAVQSGIDPAILEGMLQDAASSIGNIDAAAETEDYEQIINTIRGDQAPLSERRAELAGVVGDADAAQTPESVLTLVQPMMQIAAVDQGIGSMAPEAMNSPVEGDMAGGIMSTINMQEEQPMPGPGGPAPVNFNQGGPVRYMETGGDPVGGRLGEIYTDKQALYGSILGQTDQAKELEEQKKMTQAQMLLDIAQGGLMLATAGDRAMSPAERLAQAFTPVLGNIGARAGELQKFKQAQKQEQRALNLQALGAAESTLAAENKAKADQAIMEAEQAWKSQESALSRAHELLKLDKTFAFNRQENESNQNFQERLADRKIEAQKLLQILQGSQSQEDILLRGQLQQELAQINNAFRQQLQTSQFDFTTSERLATQEYNNSVQQQKFANDKALLALQFDNSQEAAELRQRLEQENLRLQSELRKGEYTLQFENQLQRDGIQNAHELTKMDKGQEFNKELLDYKAAIEDKVRADTQAFQASQAVLDRALRENLQLSSQDFQKLMAEELREFQGSEADKNRAIQDAQQAIDKWYKENNIEISQGQLDIAQAAQALDEKYKTGKLALDALAAKAVKLGSEAKTNTITYITNPERMQKYRSGELGSEAVTYEQTILDYIDGAGKEYYDPDTGTFVKSTAIELAPAVLESLKQGNVAFYNQVLNKIGGEGSAAPGAGSQDGDGAGTTPVAPEAPTKLGDATIQLFNPDGTVNTASEAWSLTAPNRFNPEIDYGQVIGLSRVYPGLRTMASEGYAELADGVPTEAANQHKEAQKTLTALANDLLQFSTNIGDDRVLKFVQELIEEEQKDLRPGGLLLKTDADAKATLKTLSDTLSQAMQIEARKLTEYGGNSAMYTKNQVTSARSRMDEMKVLLNEILAFEKGFSGPTTSSGPGNVPGVNQSVSSTRDLIKSMEAENR